MSITICGAEQWAQEEFSGVELRDVRRTRRLVGVAAALARCPSGTLPQALPEWSELKGAYRLFDNPDVNDQAILAPHLARTRERCAEVGETLLVEDTTLLDYSSHRATRGPGRIGNDRGRGLLLHTTLAVRVEAWDAGGRPQTRVLGLAGQECWARTGPPARQQKERWRQRLQRPRESERWARALAQLPVRSEGSQCIYVADRESDIYEVFERCRQNGVRFLVRAQFARAVAGTEGSVFAAVARAPVMGQMTVEVRGREGQAARTAVVEVRACTVSLRGVWRPEGVRADLSVQVVQAAEVGAPAGVEPLRRVLLTDLPVETMEQARRVVGRYTRRWLIEEYHKALKTGAKVEQSQLENAERLQALVAVLAVVAVRLLNAKLLARAQPDAKVDVQIFGAEALALLSAQRGEPAGGWTQATVWVAVARLGGFLARRGDGPPGWQTIWRGWQRLMTMVEGVQIIQNTGHNSEVKKCG